MFNSIFLLGNPGGAGGGGADMNFLVMMLAVAVIFYFFMIRPQAKKAKETRKFREEIGKGDRVVTIGGIHGKVAEVKDNSLVIEVEGGTRLRVEKSAVSFEYTSGTGTSDLQQNKKG